MTIVPEGPVRAAAVTMHSSVARYGDPHMDGNGSASCFEES